MVASPFTGAKTGYADISSSLSTAKDGISGISLNGEGKTITALTHHLESVASHLDKLSTTASSVGEKCGTQAPVDDELAKAPTKGDVSTALTHVSVMQSRAANGSATAQDLADAKTAYSDKKSSHDAAVSRHAEETTGNGVSALSDAVTNMSGTDPGGFPGSPGTPGSPGGNDGSSPDGPPAGGDDGTSPGDTSLSGDDDPNAANQRPMMMQQPQGQPQAQGQGAPPAGGASGGGMPTMPPMSNGATMPTKGSDPLKDLGNYGDIPTYSDTDIGTSTSSDLGSPVGQSITARTGADVSGVNSPSVGAGGNQAGQPAQQGGMGMRGGMGGMGGMMGGMGAGGAGKKGKERPTILTSNRDQLGKESLEEAVEGGLLGRSTSKKPE